MPPSYSFWRIQEDAPELFVRYHDGMECAVIRFDAPDGPAEVEWVDGDSDFPTSFPNLDAAKTWIDDHADTVFGG